MSGFPTRISRTALGPKLQDRKPVVHPNKEVGKAALNLAFAQLAGCNVVSPLAWVMFESDGTVQAHAEAWDPNKSTVGPTVTKTGPGVYEIEYETTYPDDDGVDVAISLSGALAMPQTAALRHAVAEANGPNLVTVRTYNSGGAAGDTDCLCIIW